MKNMKFYIFLSVTLILISCSSPTDPIENRVNIEPLESQLKISNNSVRTIYTFTVEREASATINWTPLFDGIEILKNDSVLIDYSKIWNGSDEPVKSGDEVIVFYWDDSNKSNPIINSKVIKL